MKWTLFIQSVVVLALTTILACSSNGTDGSDVDGSTVAPDAPSQHTGPLPLITEFLTKNQTGLTDEDGATSDWIEIFNPDTAPYDLTGHYLTDSTTNSMRWAFPAGSVIQPRAYLVVFASGKNRTVAGKPLHTNFSLSSGVSASSCSQKGGEYLALTDKAGTPLLPVWKPYPGQTADVSYGLLTTAPDSQSAFFAEPTPGAPNKLTSTVTERVTFTPPSGTFGSGTTLSVKLAVTSPTAVIRYTTSRARPISVAGKLGTFTADSTTDVCTMTTHGLSSGELVRVSGPAPLVTTMNYFVTSASTNTFKLAIEPGGPAIDLTASGSFEVRRDAITGVPALTGIITTTPPITFYGGDPVQVSTTGTLPGGLAAGTTYYVVAGTANTFRLATSPSLAPLVTISTLGTGTLTIFRTPSPIYSAPIPVTVNTRIRTRAFDAGHPDGPISGEMYFAIDPAAQAMNSNLPLVVSHTWNQAMPNNLPVEGHVMIFEPKAPDNLARLTNPPDLVSPCTLERHGSSTAGDPKFTMALELQDENGVDQNCTPFGMPAESDWIMHAPYQFDRSMMHNDLIYRLSNNAGRYAVHTRFIEHIHNEQSLTDTIEGSFTGTDYFGVYSFQEKIKRGSDRVNVESLSPADTTAPAIQGGYLFKADRLDTGEIGIRPLAGQTFLNAGTGGPGSNVLAWVYPREVSSDPFKVVNTAQSSWLRGHLGDACAVLGGASFADPVSGYAKYWDVAAMVDHHILNTATKNADAFRLSSFWHKPRTGKITAGPIWDFDRAQGSTDGRDFDWGTWSPPPGTGTDFFAYPWYVDMFRDPNYWQVWIDQLEQLRQGPLATSAIHGHIDEFAGLLNPGNAAGTPAKRSAIRWTTSAPRSAASNTAITNLLFNGTYQGEVAWLKYWWAQRLTFMDNQVTRPALANLPQGTIPAASLITLTSPSTVISGVRIYYTTDGTDPRPPAPGPMVSAKAIQYTGPFTINGPTILFVRTYNPAPVAPVGSGWSAPTVYSYTPQ